MNTLKILHHTVMQGDADAAQTLADEFAKAISDITPLGVDKVRSDRYAQLSLAIDELGQDLKLPNLDSVVPLPPARLPHWDGKRQNLVIGAQSIIPVKAPPKKEVRTGRAHVPEGHVIVLPDRWQYGGSAARWELGMWMKRFTHSGYWQAMLGNTPLTHPMYFEIGEDLPYPNLWDTMNEFQRGTEFHWAYRGVAQAQENPIKDERIRRGIARQREVVFPLPQRSAGMTCPTSGIWHARIDDELPESKAFHVWWRQAYVEKNEPLPGPDYWILEQEFLGLRASEITWHLVEPWQSGFGTWIGNKPE